MAVLKELVRKSDVLIDNFKAGTLKKLGLDYDEMQALRPGLIYCTITGYGYTGPYRDRPGYDFIVQAIGGLMSVTGEEAGEPIRVGIAIADLLTGIYACNAITASLFSRERSGDGQRIDLSLLDSQVATLSYVASNYLISGEAPQRLGNGHPNIVPYQSFRVRDGFIAFAAGNDGQWSRFCRAIEKPEWIDDQRFATNPMRVQHREELVSLLSDLFVQREVDVWLKVCEEAGVPAGPINEIPQVFEDPQVLARNMLIETKNSLGEAIKMVASPLKTLNEAPSLRHAPPLHGEHTEQVLAELLGFDETRISQLRETKVI
jgi:crotonobetainyl-CoA:carnitine CoA-transferase CaiB-like acyl-CoA transferase